MRIYPANVVPIFCGLGSDGEKGWVKFDLYVMGMEFAYGEWGSFWNWRYVQRTGG